MLNLTKKSIRLSVISECRKVQLLKMYQAIFINMLIKPNQQAKRQMISCKLVLMTN